MLDGLAARLGYGGGGEMSPDWLLPYIDHVADGVVLLRDGSLIAMARLRGVPPLLVGDPERNAQFRRHVAFLNAVSDENMPILRIFFATETPRVFIGTQINDLFLCTAPSPVLASRQHQSACVPLVVHILPPLMT